MHAVAVTSPHRLARSLGLTCAALVAGAGAHLAGGGTVGLAGLALAVPVLLGLAWPLTARECGWLPIAGAQLAGQQVVHALLEQGAQPGAAAAGLPADVFLYAHVAAAALMAAWLRCGERRVWAAARRAVRAAVAHLRLLVALLGRATPPPGVPHPVPASAPPASPRTVLRHAVVRRGPPVHV